MENNKIKNKKQKIARDAIKESLKIINNHFLTIESGKPGSRYKSWEYCHFAFLQKKNQKGPLTDDDYCLLSLHLAVYLASYGMLRNSFLLERDFQTHYGAVKICMDEKYKELWDLKPRKKDKEYIANLLFDKDEGIVNRLKEKAYALDDDEKSGSEKSSSMPTDMLVSKILLGVFGCVPAFDSFFSLGYRLIHDEATLKRAFLQLDRKNFETVYDMACDYSDVLKIKGHNPPYPPMRCLDFALWLIGECVSNANSIALEKEKVDMTLVKYGVLKEKDITGGCHSWRHIKSFHKLLPYWEPSKIKKKCD